MAKFVPRYTFWEGLNIAIHLAMQAIDEVRALARLPGPAGKDGRDGFGFDDMDMVETEKGWVFRFSRGDVLKEWRPGIPRDVGIYKEGQSYYRGDGVSYAGSWFIAQQDTTDKPESSKAWRLAIKRGRDGRNGEAPAPAPRGPIKVG